MNARAAVSATAGASALAQNFVLPFWVGGRQKGSMSITVSRVERGGHYKIVTAGGNVISLNKNNTLGGISLTFEDDEHTNYYANKHQHEGNIRIVKFRVQKEFWEAVKLKRDHRTIPKDLTQQLESKFKWVSNLPAPTVSDGQAVSKAGRQNALSFKPPWLPVIKKAIETGSASIEYVNPDEYIALVGPDNEETKDYTWNDLMDHRQDYGLDGYQLSPSLWSRPNEVK